MSYAYDWDRLEKSFEDKGFAKCESLTEMVEASPVVVFMRGNCPHCDPTLDLLKSLGVDAFVQDLQGQHDLAAEVGGLNKSVPQTYIGAKNVGNTRALAAAHKNGSLLELLNEATDGYRLSSSPQVLSCAREMAGVASGSKQQASRFSDTAESCSAPEGTGLSALD